MAKKETTPRTVFIETAGINRIAAKAWDAMQLASHHDPEHAKAISTLDRLLQAEVKFQDRRYRDLVSRISTIEHQVENLGAPQYRTIQKAKIHPRTPGKKAING